MNPDYFGDSYDVVKRFFCTELRALNYAVVVNPMLTGLWGGIEAQFYRFIGAEPVVARGARSAIFFDPDTGVHHKPSRQHLSIQQLAEAAQHHELAFSFDQSFSRQHTPAAVMQHKLSALQECGVHGLYYNSHARFLFASSREHSLTEFREHLLSLGMPSSRLVSNGT